MSGLLPNNRDHRANTRLVNAAAVFVSAATIFYFYTIGVQLYRSYVPASEWYEVTALEVPDHTKLSNPEIVFGQTVHVPFRGQWVIEYMKKQPTGEFFAVCTNSGLSNFNVEDTVVRATIRIREFIERVCDVEPGDYLLRGELRMTRPEWPAKTVRVWSNEFRIRDEL